ncbi:unnamed protein product [Rotaria sp. Silwood2]|nr:unnamed protein product [Rotaria sp. Silwood2]CAF2985843.1 unnamed protein product [Rotaria sp. Silwood2]CAF3964722.1 unnamed protein product [Rotaria sp. Silwood2]CAF4394703.1 unnamed protein product [Rotaria sp. Silwood2]
MSFVCGVAFSQLQGSSLPIQHILLYEAIANSTLSLWSNKRSTIPIEELIRILSDIASTIHGNFASGLIHEEKLNEICIQTIKDSLGNNVYTKEYIEEIENQASEFV